MNTVTEIKYDSHETKNKTTKMNNNNDKFTFAMEGTDEEPKHCSHCGM